MPALQHLIERPIAHRGLHDRAVGAPENSRTAILRAARAGFGVEIDVQLSADGDAIVIHDATVDRTTTGSGAVSTLTASEIAQLRLLDAAEPEAPPTLSSILENLQHLRCETGVAAPLFVEVKASNGRPGADEGRLEARVAELLRSHQGPSAVMSFDPECVAQLKRLAPDVARGLISCAHEAVSDPVKRAALADLSAFSDVGASFISYHWRDLPHPPVAARRAAGAPVITWTLTSARDAKRAVEHCDQITFENFTP